jgi:hypothetical protein
VIVVAEEIRTSDEILSDPNLVLAPPGKIACGGPRAFGRLPLPLQGLLRARP